MHAYLHVPTCNIAACESTAHMQSVLVFMHGTV